LERVCNIGNIHIQHPIYIVFIVVIVVDFFVFIVVIVVDFFVVYQFSLNIIKLILDQ